MCTFTVRLLCGIHRHTHTHIISGYIIERAHDATSDVNNTTALRVLLILLDLEDFAISNRRIRSAVSLPALGGTMRAEATTTRAQTRIDAPARPPRAATGDPKQVCREPLARTRRLSRNTKNCGGDRGRLRTNTPSISVCMSVNRNDSLCKMRDDH